jgi:hypothetical protein
MAMEDWREKVVSELKSRLAKQLLKEHELSVSLVDTGLASIEVVVKVSALLPTDDLIKEDRHRRDHASPEGKSLVWVKTSGGIVAKAGLQIPVPVEGVSASVGFSANGFVDCCVIAPYPLGFEEALAAAKQAFGNLPLSAEAAAEMQQGTEASLRGYGALAGRCSIGIGKKISALSGAVSFGGGIDVGIGVGCARDISLTVKRLDDSLVYVALAAGKTVSRHLSVKLGLGVDAVDSDFLPSPAQIERIADTLAEKVVDKLEAQVKFETTVSATGTDIMAYVIDLSQEGGRRAFADLVRLDARKADDLFAVGGPKDGIVREARMDEETLERKRGWRANVFGLQLLESIDSSTYASGEGKHPDGTPYKWWQTALKDGYHGAISGIFRGKREIQREMIGWRRKGTTDAEVFYHVKYTVKGDRVTSAADIKRFVAFASVLGGELDPVDASLVDGSTEFGKTDRVIDVYVTREGLAALFGAPPQQLMAAYAKVYELLDEPWRNSPRAWHETPWLAEHPDGAKVRACLERVRSKGGYSYLEEHPYAGDAMGEKRDMTDEYLRLTGRSLERDSAAYIQSSRLCDMIHELDAAAGEADAGRLFEEFADCDRRLGLDFWNELGMLAVVVGPEAMLISQLAITGEDGLKVEFAAEGKLVGIREKLEEAIKAMST